MNIEYLNHFGNCLMVANAARVSFNNWKTKLDDKDIKLIKYLAKEGHISPFFHPKIQMRFIVPLFLAAQLKRHQVGFDLSEVSRRYVDYEPSFYTPDKLGARADNKKQGSKEDEFITEIKHAIFTYTVEEYLSSYYDECLFAYNDLLKAGVSPEYARLVLPTATLTSFVWTGSLYGYFRVYSQRIHKSAQKEAQEIAQMINDIIEPLFPYSWLALKEANKNDN